MFIEHGFRVLGVTMLFLIATTYAELTMLSDFPELAHLIFTKFKYCYYPPFYRQGNCGPEPLSSLPQIRSEFPPKFFIITFYLSLSEI